MRKILTIAALLLCLTSLGQYSDNIVKMGLIRGFIQHTQWPNEDKLKNFTVGYWSNDSSLVSAFELLAKTGKVKGKSIIVKRLRTVQDVLGLQVLYLDRRLGITIESTFKSCKQANTLLVTEDCTDQQIVMINLLPVGDDGKPRFEINKANIIFARLNPSPHLLLLGGSEIDIREMYRRSEEASQKLRMQLDTQHAALAMQTEQMMVQQKQIEQHKRGIENQQQQLSRQNASIDSQKTELSNLNSRVWSKENELKIKELSIKIQEKNLISKEEQLHSLKQLEKEQQEKSKRQSTMLEIQKKDIKKQQAILEQQNQSIIGFRHALQIYTIFLFVVVVLGILALRGFIQKKKMNKILHEQNDEIFEKTILLEKQKVELQGTLENLQNTQNQLIQSEKMASLGQLIAGIAHEINTPIGAIKASVGIITHSTKNTLVSMPDIVKSLTTDEYNLFINIIERSVENTSQLTSKEERTIRKTFVTTLENNNITNAHQIADNLVDMGIHSDIESYIPLLVKNNDALVFTHCFEIVQQIKNSQNIQMAVDKISKIIFALKSYAHYGDHNEMVKSNITSGIETVLTLYQNQMKRSVKLERRYNEIPEIFCYPDELNQVWTNLIHNALQAMKNEGEITISVEQSGSHVKVVISDNGSGIPEDVQPRIFDAFFTTKAAGEGSGLGLHIVKEIIDKHHGEISFESYINKGTSFTVLIPIIVKV